jgi:RecA-family ATPase
MQHNAPRPSVESTRNAWLQFNGMFCAGDLSDHPVPSRIWAVDGLIPHKVVTLFSGDGGTGKSTLALQLACSTALGRQWLGRDTNKGRVVYLSAEDDRDELHIRLSAIAKGEGFTLKDIGDRLAIYDRTGMDNAVMVRGERYSTTFEASMFWSGLQNWMTDGDFKLLILDSLYDFFTAKQIDQADATRFMGMLRETAKEADCAILVLWHPSKSGMDTGDGTSGNVAFRNKARAMLYLERDKEATGPDAPLILHRGKKANYGPAESAVSIKYDRGRFVLLDEPSAVSGVIGTIAVDQAFLACLDATNGQGRTVSHSNRGANFAPKAFAKMPQAKGFKANELAKAMERLFDEGKIVVGLVGRDASRNRKTGIIRAEPEAPQSPE